MFFPTLLRAGAVVCVCTLASAPAASAAPSEADIVEQLTHAGTIEVRVSPRPGKRHTSASRDGNSVAVDHHWARGVTILRKADLDGFPDARIELDGSVRYDILPGGFSYREFKTSQSRYLDLAAPTEEEVTEALQANLRDVIGGTLYDTGVVGGGVVFTLAEEPAWEWHTPTSVSVDVTAAYVRRAEAPEPAAVEQVERPYRVRLYREEPTAAFTSTTRASQRGEPEVTARKELSPAQMAALRSIGEQAALDAAQAEADALPDVEVPAFRTDAELFAYTHKMLREAPDAELEAYLRLVAADAYLRDGGPTLTPAGQAWLDEILAEARGKKLTYADTYGPDPELKHVQGGQAQWFTSLKPVHAATSRMTAVLGGGTMRNGQMQGQELRLGVVDLHVSDKPEHAAWLASFDSPEALAALHAGKPTLQGLVAERAASLAPPPVQVDWSTFTSEAVGYRVELPGEPVLSEELANGKYPRHLADVEVGGGMVRIAVNLYRVELTEAQARPLVDGTGEGYAKMIDAELLGGSGWDLGGVYARRFRFSHPEHQVSYACGVKGNAFYTVSVIGPDANDNKAWADRVLGSLQAP